MSGPTYALESLCSSKTARSLRQCTSNSSLRCFGRRLRCIISKRVILACCASCETETCQILSQGAPISGVTHFRYPRPKSFSETRVSRRANGRTGCPPSFWGPVSCIWCPRRISRYESTRINMPQRRTYCCATRSLELRQELLNRLGRSRSAYTLSSQPQCSPTCCAS